MKLPLNFRGTHPLLQKTKKGGGWVAGGIAVLRAQRAGATGVRDKRLRLDRTPVVTVVAVEDRHIFRRHEIPLWFDCDGIPCDGAVQSVSHFRRFDVIWSICAICDFSSAMGDGSNQMRWIRVIRKIRVHPCPNMRWEMSAMASRLHGPNETVLARSDG